MEKHSNLERRDAIRDFWNNHYEHTYEVTPPSLFAIHTLESLTGALNLRLLDYGCGNGRDSIFFSKYFEVLGVDLSEIVINQNTIIGKQLGSAAKFSVLEKNKNLTNLIESFDPDVFYARFLLHAITLEHENQMLSSLADALRIGAIVCFECRTTKDPLMQKGIKVSEFERIYGHYRRFIVPDELRSRLISLGFQINSFEESNEFSPTLTDKPYLLRVSAMKIT